MLKLKQPIAKLKENERTMAAAKKTPKRRKAKTRKTRKGGCR